MMYSLILSGGGTRGFYTVGVLQALEECGYREQINAIYGVSAGAIIGVLWACGYSARRMKTTFTSFLRSNATAIKPSLNSGLVDTQRITNFLGTYMPATFASVRDEYGIDVHVGASDLVSGEYVSFTSGEIMPAVMASMAVPGAFAPVRYRDMYLVDGGIIDAYPIEEAIAGHPHNQTIGVTLLYKQKVAAPVDNVFWVLNRAFDLSRQASVINSAKRTDYLLNYDCDYGLLDMDVLHRERSYHQGYRDARALCGEMKNNQ